MTLDLGTVLLAAGGDPTPGTDPHEDSTGVTPRTVPSGTIYEVECWVTTKHNVLGSVLQIQDK